MRTVQITIAYTKGEREREREKLGTQGLILPIMERRSFNVNRNIHIIIYDKQWTIQIATRKTQPIVTLTSSPTPIMFFVKRRGLFKNLRFRNDRYYYIYELQHLFICLVICSGRCFVGLGTTLGCARGCAVGPHQWGPRKSILPSSSSIYSGRFATRQLVDLFLLLLFLFFVVFVLQCQGQV